MFKKDQLILGTTLGLVAPVAALFVFYLVKFYPTFSLSDFFLYLKLQKSLLSGILSVCLIANAALFTLFINQKSDKTAKGIFIITVLYAVVALLFKFFG